MMMHKHVATALLLGALVVSSVQADPCGMVPPIYTGNLTPITRIGLQQTYVFYKKGVESVVIRPGFQGNVDNFGMLIPFPSPPELRKVPDPIFEHLDNAIDPPEVVVDLRRFGGGGFGGGGFGGGGAGARLAFNQEEVSEDEVRVVKQEAVGMYEVAVLEAGSARVLKKWLEENKFQYPKGMDDVTEDYVKAGWCFVAVKTKVGQKNGANPVAGQRTINTQLPSGAVFDGHVQGMGFRFRSDKLIVPMRLSAFNEGELRNVVYLLTHGPRRIRNIPEEYVVRQVKGSQLLKNLTQPLPLRIFGGTVQDLDPARRESLKEDRNPIAKNGVAKTLFASDLLAVETEELSLKMEEDEKELLAINELMGLRGAEIDQVVLETQQVKAEAIAQQSLKGLNRMTLTLVDGDFPRQVIANQNLKFARYAMSPRRNRSSVYDAKLHGPPARRMGAQGLRIGQVDLDTWEIQQQAKIERRWMFGIGLVSLGLIWTARRRRSSSRN